MATRGSEAEPVLIEESGDSLIFTLDDGECLAFNAVEFRANLGDAA